MAFLNEYSLLLVQLCFPSFSPSLSPSLFLFLSFQSQIRHVPLFPIACLCLVSLFVLVYICKVPLLSIFLLVPACLCLVSLFVHVYVCKVPVPSICLLALYACSTLLLLLSSTPSKNAGKHVMRDMTHTHPTLTSKNRHAIFPQQYPSIPLSPSSLSLFLYHFITHISVDAILFLRLDR